MKNFRFLSIPVVLLLILTSCQNTTDPNVTEETYNISINSGEVFEYPTGISGEEEGATIVRQPDNYEVSTIVRDSTTNWEAVYQYQPKAGFQGTQSVELKLSMGSDGASPSSKVTVVKLNITVD
ncbi:hypothetical protein [Fodinibius sp. Rm-B-1B1-1]|uniref:hypothetical protein n=1 Tax=Fodinibius alkaliphilus TaxID=3140241 RepID=UPI00315B232D